ncbi:MAG: hypothetical protein WCK98_01195 [bacterium]
MPTQKLSTKTLKSKISLEKRLQFYSLITRKTEDYLSNILGKETFESLKNCELTGPEIQQINQDLISIIQSEHENADIEGGNNNLEKEITSKKIILLRPELVICSELILEFLLSQRVEIGNIIESNVYSNELVDLFSNRHTDNLPTAIINFIHSPAKAIYLKEPLIEAHQQFIEQNIIKKEYDLIAKIFGSRVYSLLDPIKYIQNCYLGLIDKKIDTSKPYLVILKDSLTIG